MELDERKREDQTVLQIPEDDRDPFEERTVMFTGETTFPAADAPRTVQPDLQPAAAVSADAAAAPAADDTAAASPDDDPAERFAGRTQEPAATVPPAPNPQGRPYPGGQPQPFFPEWEGINRSGAMPYTAGRSVYSDLRYPVYLQQPVPPAAPGLPLKEEKKKKDPMRKRFVAFGAVMLAVCLVCSAVTGAASSFLVLRLSSIFTTEAQSTESYVYMPDYGETQAPADDAGADPAGETAENAVQGAIPADAGNAIVIPTAPTEVTEAATTGTPAKTKGQIYSETVGSVVCVEASGTRSAQGMFGFRGGYQPVISRGSGFVYSSDGYIVTNYHVIEGMDSCTVTTFDGTEYEATVRGYDASNDIAVLKAEGSFQAVTLGASAELMVGDDLLVIGNALGELSFTFTDGVVSYLSRVVTNEDGRTIRMFQTNAAINEGNSGGPVFNMRGEVVGIASAKYASDTIEGLGFCIPIDDVKTKISDIIANGYVS